MSFFSKPFLSLKSILEYKNYNKHNYYRNTYAVYKEIDASELPFEKWHYTSKSDSAYFYTKEGVYRKSNHWGRAAKCRWVLESGNEIRHLVNTCNIH